jgi:hypothetical protein
MKEGKPYLTMDSIADFRELTDIKIAAGQTGLLMIGGGVPKNFIQDTVVCAEILGKEVDVHKYAIQITVADVRDGACSSSTLQEAASWGKVSTAMEQMVFARRPASSRCWHPMPTTAATGASGPSAASPSSSTRTEPTRNPRPYRRGFLFGQGSGQVVTPGSRPCPAVARPAGRTSDALIFQSPVFLFCRSVQIGYRTGSAASLRFLERLGGNQRRAGGRLRQLCAWQRAGLAAADQCEE